jgi:DNA-binding beta-propeller fold protein YncE
MKKGYGIALSAVVVLAASAAFGWGSLVRSYASPGQYPNGLGFLNYGGPRVYVPCRGPDRVYWMNQANGSVMGYFPTPSSVPMGCDCGVVNSTPYVWVIESNLQHMYRMGYQTGSIYGSFHTPGGLPRGVAFRQSNPFYYIYSTDGYNQHMYRMHATTGSVIASYDLNYTPYDLAYGDGYLWIATGSTVRKSTLTGSTVATISTAASGNAVGVAYDTVGPYLWVSIMSPVNRINVYELGNTPVEPSSLGRVKAVYR